MRWSVIVPSLLVLACGLALPDIAHADNTGSVVVFSYEKVAMGGDVQYMLLPSAGKMKIPPGAKPSPAVIKGAFKELRNRKPTTYGSSSIDVTTATLAKGQASVSVDATKERYFLIIAAEVVLTMEQFGIKAVSFPGHATKPMTAKDLGFGRYTLVVPAWRALPPNEILASQISLADGSTVDSDVFYRRFDQKGDEAKAILKPYLSSDDRGELLAAMQAVSVSKPSAWHELLLPLLKHKDPEIRTKILDALAGVDDESVLTAIGTVMDRDKTAEVAQRAAKILGESKNQKYKVMALFFLLRGSDEAAAVAATDKIAASKQESGVGELEKAAGDKRDKVALAAIAALGKMGRHAELSKIFEARNAKMPRRLAAAKQVVGLTDAESRFKALSFLAVSGDKDEAIGAIDALAKIKDPPGRPVIESTLQHGSVKVRTHAAAKLAEIKDPASLKALAAAATANADDTEVMQDAAADIMAKLVLADIIQYTTNRDLGLKRIAYQALGTKATDANKARIFDVLVRGATNNDEGIRRSATKALAVYGDNQKALDVLVKLAKDPDAKVRRNVARALASWKAGVQYDLLMSYIDDKDGEVAAAAVQTLHKRGDTDAYKRILDLYRGDPHPDKRVRMAALAGIVDLHPQKERQTVISVLSGGLYDKEREVKLHSLELLGRFNHSAAVTGIGLLINDPDEEYRIASLRALGKTQSPEALELLTSVLGDKSKPVRIAAITALGDLGQRAGIEHISTAIAMEKDPEIVAAGKAALRKIK